MTNERLQSYEFALTLGQRHRRERLDGAIRHYLRDRGGTRRQGDASFGDEPGMGYDALLARDARPYPTAGDPDQTYAYGLSAGQAGAGIEGKSTGVRVQLPWDFDTGNGRRQHHTPHLTTIPVILTHRQHGGARCTTPANAYGSFEGSLATGGSDADGAGSWEPAPPRHAGL